MTPSNYEWPLGEPTDLSMTSTNYEWPLNEPIALFMTQLSTLDPSEGPKFLPSKFLIRNHLHDCSKSIFLYVTPINSE